MKIKITLLSTAIATACLSLPAQAYTTGELNGDRAVGHGIQEISDNTLADMRGRYVAANNTILYFGVQMVSTWHSPDGQTVSGGVDLNMDFRAGGAMPKVSFQPTVSIVSGTSTEEVAQTSNRSIESGGIYNPSGLVQSIQVTGDGNVSENVAAIRITDRMPDDIASGSGQLVAEASSGDASVRASLQNGQARVDMLIADQGMVHQIISGGGGAGGVIQSTGILSDNNLVTNQLQLTVVQNLSGQAAQLREHAAQSIAMLRGLPQP